MASVGQDQASARNPCKHEHCKSDAVSTTSRIQQPGAGSGEPFADPGWARDAGLSRTPRFAFYFSYVQRAEHDRFVSGRR